MAPWKERPTTADHKTGPSEPQSTVLSVEDEAAIVAFRRHTLRPLDDGLYALQPTIPHLTRSSWHRCLQRHGVSRLAEVDGDKPLRSKFLRCPIGAFPIDIAEGHTEEGRLDLLVAIDRTSKFTCVAASNFARRLKTRRGPTPYQAVCKAWADERFRFTHNPHHQTAGPNI